LTAASVDAIWKRPNEFNSAGDAGDLLKPHVLTIAQGTSMHGMFALSGPSFGPAAGRRPRRLVVLLHGYGADGNDLLGLAPHWSRLLPDAEFLAPHAPYPCEAAPFGRQWFGFEDRDENMILAETKTAAAILDGFIDGELGRRTLSEDDLAVVGFSQGTMMALHVAPRRARAIAAVVGYSGALIAPQLLAQEMKSKPPVLLVHGDADPVVNYASLAVAQSALAAVGIPVVAETRRGLAHAIDEVGLARGGAFIAGAFARAAM
jgi:phospholipase/carboxylesterase